MRNELQAQCHGCAAVMMIHGCGATLSMADAEGESRSHAPGHCHLDYLPVRDLFRAKPAEMQRCRPVGQALAVIWCHRGCRVERERETWPSSRQITWHLTATEGRHSIRTVSLHLAQLTELKTEIILRRLTEPASQNVSYSQ